MNYINFLVGHPQLEYYYLMMANAKNFILPSYAIYSFKMKLYSIIQVCLMDLNTCVFLGFFKSKHICTHDKDVVMLLGPNYCPLN